MNQQELLPPLGGFTSEQIAWLDRRYMQHPSSAAELHSPVMLRTTLLEIRRFIIQSLDLIKNEYSSNQFALDDLRGFLARRMPLKDADLLPSFHNRGGRLTNFERAVYDALVDWPENPFERLTNGRSSRIVYRIKP